MRAVIVPLALIFVLLVAYVIWQARAAIETKRREDREREREREQWADRMMKGEDEV